MHHIYSIFENEKFFSNISSQIVLEKLNEEINCIKKWIQIFIEINLLVKQLRNGLTERYFNRHMRICLLLIKKKNEICLISKCSGLFLYTTNYTRFPHCMSLSQNYTVLTQTPNRYELKGIVGYSGCRTGNSYKN